MAGNDKVLINLATAMEDGEKVLISLLVATAARQQGKQVRIPHTEIVGATPMWEWAGDDTIVFSY